MNETQQIARESIAFGEDPEGLVHVIHFDGGITLSSSISLEDYQRGGYTSVYYTLGYLAGFTVQRVEDPHKLGEWRLKVGCFEAAFTRREQAMSAMAKIINAGKRGVVFGMARNAAHDQSFSRSRVFA